MGYIAKLVYGSRTLDLNAAPYALLPDFSPPGIDRGLSIGAGTSANVYGGGEVIGQKLNDRAWSFGVRIMGTTSAQTHMAARRLQAFLDLAYDKSDKLYLEYKPSDAVSYKPLWGQDRYRYQIKSGEIPELQNYAVADLRTRVLFLTVSVLIAPEALGYEQQLGQVVGGVVEDYMGSPDRQSRGTIMPRATTNLITNPIFGHATWNTGWTAGANIIASQNTDPEYILFGTSSAKLTAIAAANNDFYQSLTLTVAAYAFSVYAKLQDGGVIDSSIMPLRYAGGNLTTEYLPVGNGWYRLMATTTGQASAQRVAVILTSGQTIYIDGYQCETGSVPTPLCHGGMMGCAWSGTAHESSSTRTAGRYKVTGSSALGIQAGTVRCAIKWGQPHDTSADLTIWSDGTKGLGYVAASDKLDFTDGTNSVGSGGAVLTHEVGDIDVFHCTYGFAGLAIYRNGALYHNGANFTPAAIGAMLFVGSNATPANSHASTYLDFVTYDRAMTATEVANDYADISAHVRGGGGYGQALTRLPWFWTQDGDNQLDGCCDATPRLNYGVAGGIPGNLPAITRYRITLATAAVRGAIWLGLIRMRLDNFLKFENYFYNDANATGTTSADSGSAATTTSINTGGTEIQVINNAAPDNRHISITGRYHYFTRLSDTTGNLQVHAIWTAGGSSGIATDDKVLTTDASRRMYYVGSLLTSQINSEGFPDSEKRQIFSIYYSRTTGSGNMTYDYHMAIPGKLLYITTPGGFLADNIMNLEGKRGTDLYNTSVQQGILRTKGERIDFEPGYLNALVFVSGDDGGTSSAADAATIVPYITPRWAIL